MKLTTSNRAQSSRAHRDQRGFMVIAMMAILAMMLIYVAASACSLRQLRQDLKLVEQKQVQRLQSPAPPVTRTNAAAIAP